jgi:hypothetical protein
MIVKIFLPQDLSSFHIIMCESFYSYFFWSMQYQLVPIKIVPESTKYNLRLVDGSQYLVGKSKLIWIGIYV